MTQEILNIVLAGVSIIITGLASAAVIWFKQWINRKIKDKQFAEYTCQLVDIVYNCVTEVNQTYVDTLKKEGNFNKETQKIALEKCLAKVKSKLSADLTAYIEENFGDITSHLTTLIESAVYNLKK